MALFNCRFYRAEYLCEFSAVHIVFNGKMETNEVIKLRDILESLAESLKIEKLILDFTECDQVFIDYTSQSRIAFWRNMEKHGLKMLLLIIPSNNFRRNPLASWESFYKKNSLAIEVSAISNRKLMPLYILDERLTSQLN